MTLFDSAELDSEDEKDVLATAKVIIPIFLYVIFLAIVPTSLVLIGFLFIRVETRLQPDQPAAGHRRSTSRKYLNWNSVGFDSNLNYNCLMQTFCNAWESGNKSSGSRRSLMTRFLRSMALGENISTWISKSADVSCKIIANFKCSNKDKSMKNNSPYSMRQHEAEPVPVVKIQSFPMLEWLGLANPNDPHQVSNLVNYLFWPLYSYGVFALATPIVLFLVLTFLIPLTVYSDEGEAKHPMPL